MIGAMKAELERMGFTVNERPYAIIRECDRWYRDQDIPDHTFTTVSGETFELDHLDFARRLAGDDANLCEVVEVNAGGDDDDQFRGVNAVLDDNRFATEYRRQLEETAAEGTSAAYVWLEKADTMTDGSLSGGRIRIGYVDALSFVPLKVENGEVLDAAFCGEDSAGGKKIYRLIVCARDGAGRYVYRLRAWDEAGRAIEGLKDDVQLGRVKPFAVLRTAQVNTLRDMQGFGFPKLYDMEPILIGLDAAFTALSEDVKGAGKLTLVNEQLCRFDDNGKPITPSQQMKKHFVLLGEKLPQQNSLVQEINPDVRIEKFRQVIEFYLGLAGMQFGFGTKKYTFDRDTNTIATATQYIGERQDQMQELNRQRAEARRYIADLCRAVMWFMNTFQGKAWNLDAEVLVEFDDSYVTNRAQQLEDMRADVLSGIGGAWVRRLYLMQRYNLTEEEAAKWAALDDEDALGETED